VDIELNLESKHKLYRDNLRLNHFESTIGELAKARDGFREFAKEAELYQQSFDNI
jgi:hypothetical protein